MKAFVVCRDRVTYARRCVDALTTAGLDIVVVDHGSAWPPMLDWLVDLDVESIARTDVEVAWWPNQHPRDLWAPGGPIEIHLGAMERFIVTDCDVVPDEACPADWVDRLVDLLDRFPGARKAGLGLRTDDLPVHFADRDRVIVWERQYQHVDDGGRLYASAGLGEAVWADIDTTLAMYRGFEAFTLGPALRMRPPFVARHLAWYEDTADPTPEQAFYRSRAEHGHWRQPDGFIDEHGLRGSS